MLSLTLLAVSAMPFAQPPVKLGQVTLPPALTITITRVDDPDMAVMNGTVAVLSYRGNGVWQGRANNIAFVAQVDISSGSPGGVWSIGSTGGAVLPSGAVNPEIWPLETKASFKAMSISPVLVSGAWASGRSQLKGRPFYFNQDVSFTLR